MRAERVLRSFRAPDERPAQDRAWEVVRSAYQPRSALARRPLYRRRVAALAVGVALVGGFALSPAGATVGRLITRALGVQPSARALFALPAPGRLLVSGRAGTWTVASDGAVRRIGRWTQASWSPHGLYLAAATSDELAAVNPRGTVEWLLRRPRISDPRWYSPTGYRLAYLSGRDLRVVAGDGSADHFLAGPVAPVAPAWRPDHSFQLAYMSAGGVLTVRDGDSGQMIWSTRPRAVIKALAWSADGQRLLAMSPSAAFIYNASGRLLSRRAAPPGAPIVDAMLSPDGSRLALVLGGSGGAVVTENAAARHPAARRELSGVGLGQVAWSPDGRWLLVSWPAANQWVFIRVLGAPRISAVSRITQQFSSGTRGRLPGLEGWCCTAAGAAG